MGNSNKFTCCNCDNIATWIYMPGDSNPDHKIEDDFFCDDCVPKGCSCNNESICFHESENFEELESQANDLKERINKYPFIMVNYGSIEHCSGKELETITNIKLIRNIVNNITNEQLRHFVFKPLDEKGREFPCCEFEYDKNGFLKIDFKD